MIEFKVRAEFSNPDNASSAGNAERSFEDSLEADFYLDLMVSFGCDYAEIRRIISANGITSTNELVRKFER